MDRHFHDHAASLTFCQCTVEDGCGNNMGSNPFGFPCVGLLVVELEHMEHKHKRHTSRKTLFNFNCSTIVVFIATDSIQVMMQLHKERSSSSQRSTAQGVTSSFMGKKNIGFDLTDSRTQ